MNKFSFKIPDYFIAIFLKGLSVLTSYGLTLAVSNTYDGQFLGIFSTVTTVTLFFVWVGRFGLDTAFVKYTSQLKAQNSIDRIPALYMHTLLSNAFIGLLVSAPLCLFSNEIAVHIFKKEYYSPHLFYSGLLIFPTVLIFLHSEGLRGLGELIGYFITQLIAVNGLALSLFYVLYYLFSQHNPFLIYQCLLISTYVVLACSVIWFYSKSPRMSVGKKYPMKAVYTTAIPIFFTNMLWVILGWTDTLLLAIYRSDQEVGLYTVCLKVSNAILLPSMAISAAIGAKIAYEYGVSNFTGLKNLMHKSYKTILLCSIPILVLVGIFSRYLLSFFNPAFSDHYLLLLLLLTGQCINVFSGPVDMFLQMTGNEKMFRNFILVATFVNVCMNVLLIPLYGIVGAAIANIVSICVWNVASVIYIKRKYSFVMLSFFSFKKNRV